MKRATAPTDTSALVKVLLSPGFLIGVGLLLINDFYLKQAFGNFVTGKLSDFSGLFSLALFLSGLAPRRALVLHLLLAAGFVFWKSSAAASLIEVVNAMGVLRIGRTVDFTDCVALGILPFSYKYFRSRMRTGVLFQPKQRTAVLAALFVSVFAFTATSFENERQVWLDQTYRLEMTRVDFERRLREVKSIEMVEIEKTTDAWPADKYPDVETRDNEYYVRFRIRRAYCESQDVRVFAGLEDNASNITLSNPSLDYWCSKPPEAEDRAKLTTILEEAVIGQLEGLQYK